MQSGLELIQLLIHVFLTSVTDPLCLKSSFTVCYTTTSSADTSDQWARWMFSHGFYWCKLSNSSTDLDTANTLQVWSFSPFTIKCMLFISYLTILQTTQLHILQLNCILLEPLLRGPLYKCANLPLYWVQLSQSSTLSVSVTSLILYALTPNPANIYKTFWKIYSESLC